jgi:parallel beta-helix repeat protein
VQTENLLLEECVAIGASDAGIYVGQSRNVVVRNNSAERNVAGIEIENTFDADVYGNTASENTGGILVFNMPDLPQPGHSTRVYQNTISANNTKNFGAEGTPVASVPAGSGIVIYANDKIEIFDNDIADNNTANIIISSYYGSDLQGTRELAANYDPYPETIFIYGNRFSGGGSSPDGLDLKALKVAMFGLTGSFPDILWDGYVNAEKADAEARLKPEYAICVDNGATATILWSATISIVAYTRSYRPWCWRRRWANCAPTRSIVRGVAAACGLRGGGPARRSARR